MNWLSEIQLFRKHPDRIKMQVGIFEKEAPPDETNVKQLMLFIESIAIIDQELDTTEKNILYSLNNGRNYWVDDFGNDTACCKDADMENHLFDSMKNSYTGL